MNKTYYVAIVMAGLSLTACKNGTEQLSVAPVKVKVHEVVCAKNEAVRTFSGTVEEEVGTLVSFPMGGTIQTLHVAIGQRVVAGQLLATIDPTSAKSSYDAALAVLDQARDAYARMKQLYDKGSLPEIQWIEVQSKLQQAESMESIAKKNLSDCKIYAPYSGVIASKDVEVGQQVAPGMTVTKVVKIDRVKIKIAVPEAEIATVKVGQEATVSVTALGNQTFTGHVIEKGVAANPLSHAYEVKILVENRSKALMPGMVSKIALVADDAALAIALPGNVVQLDENNQTFVWVAEDGHAVRRFVTCGEASPKGVNIVAGLQADDVVIVEGQQKVSEMTPIEIVR
jgi:RND family efflux transporter MFP subunit